MKQSFTEKSLEKFYTAKDFYKLGIKSENLDFTNILMQLEKEEISFPRFKVINSIFINTSISLEYVLLIRKLNDNIKRLYGVKQADRHSIVQQVQILLQETSRPISILRFDIQKFYDSIDKNLVLEKVIENDSLLSYQSKYVLKNLLLENTQFKKQEGLPFGLNISATLSEIYMKSFDRNIKKMDGIYFYVRYVDDILIFTYTEEDIEDKIKNILPKNLHFHEDSEYKKKLIKLPFKTSEGSFDYLGYNFSIKNEQLITSIADIKIKKIKSRIIMSFVSYFRDKDFLLLHQRIKFLTSNYYIRQENKYANEREVKKLKSGIYYNYKLIDTNNLGQLKNLDIFLQKSISAKEGKFGTKVSRLLTQNQRNKLKKYSFKVGFEKKISHNFNEITLSKITKGWQS